MIGQCFQRIALASVWGILPIGEKRGEEQQGHKQEDVTGLCDVLTWHALRCQRCRM